MDLENYLKRHTNFRKQYKLFGEIGKGAFGKVYLAENKDKTEKVSQGGTCRGGVAVTTYSR